jgi:hypothetical protein
MSFVHDEQARAERAAAARRSTARGDRARDVAGVIARLQRTAGNRAVTAQLADLSLQRHPEQTMPGEVGDPAAADAAAPAPAVAAPEQATEPGTGTGTGTGTGGSRAPATPSRQAQVYAKLNTTDTGRWALGIIDRWRIPVDYNFAGVGSFHRAGSIFINRSLSIDAAALVTMHEAQHANTFKSGRAADVRSLSRAAYITRKIADEAEAVVRQIEGAVPMAAAGANLAGSGVTQGLINRYRAAFYRKRDELQASDPSLTRAQINARCRTFVRDTEVTRWFHDGTFVTSTGGAARVTYSQHYGAAWDAEHRPPSPSPAEPAEAPA